MDDINRALEAENLSEFSIWSYEHGRLLLLASDDLAYYHLVEIAFEGVAYIDAPTTFWRPRIREATGAEAASFRASRGVEDEARVFVIEDQRGDDETSSHTIAAEGVSLDTGMVYHYDRPDLKPGERVAPWVRR